jgi:hypothetical protein
VAKYGRGFCELCGREEERLGRNEWLEGHHVVEYARGGSAERENVWILCVTCSRLVHWVRALCREISPQRTRRGTEEDDGKEKDGQEEGGETEAESEREES